MSLLSRLRRLLTPDQGKLVEAAADVTVPGSAGLSDIRHVVIAMQENRPFGHYFGTIGGIVTAELLAACRCEYVALRPGRMVMKE